MTNNFTFLYTGGSFPTDIRNQADINTIGQNLFLDDGTTQLPIARFPIYSTDSLGINNISIMIENDIANVYIHLIPQNTRSGGISMDYDFKWVGNYGPSVGDWYAGDIYDISVFQQIGPNYITTVNSTGTTIEDCRSMVISPEIVNPKMTYGDMFSVICRTGSDVWWGLHPIPTETELREAIKTQLWRLENSKIFPIKKSNTGMNCLYQLWSNDNIPNPSTLFICLENNIKFNVPLPHPYQVFYCKLDQNCDNNIMLYGRWTGKPDGYEFTWNNDASGSIYNCYSYLMISNYDMCTDVVFPTGNLYYVPASIWVGTNDTVVTVEYINLQGYKATTTIEIGPSGIWNNRVSIPSYIPMLDVSRILSRIVNHLAYNAKTFPGNIKSPTPYSGTGPSNQLACQQYLSSPPENNGSTLLWWIILAVIIFAISYGLTNTCFNTKQSTKVKFKSTY